MTNARACLVVFSVLTVVTGVVYPLAITGAARVLFPAKATGSLLRAADGRVVGSGLIGQSFAPTGELEADAAVMARWLWGRPSATAPAPYTALNIEKGTGSSGSNLGPSNPSLVANVRARLAALDAADKSVGLVRAGTQVPVPVDLVTASASGLDPHISPAAAAYQVPRVARARGMTEAAVAAVVRRHTSGPALLILGEPVVNVLGVNLELEGVVR